jgi:hypothetical protein
MCVCCARHPGSVGRNYAPLLNVERAMGVSWRHAASTLSAADLAWIAALSPRLKRPETLVG